MPGTSEQKPRRLEFFLNYLWQLRPYSYADLVLLLIAFGADTRSVVSSSCLWFGFLIHLEWQHNDRGRLRWPWIAWVVPWIVGGALAVNVYTLCFLTLSILYSLKKKYKILTRLSCFINGGIKASLVATLPGAIIAGVAIVFVVMTLRNLVGDVRDAAKDSAEGIQSLPVVFGYKKSTHLIYPCCLALTSTLWTVLGDLPWWALAVALLVEVSTYGRTPR